MASEEIPSTRIPLRPSSQFPQHPSKGRITLKKIGVRKPSAAVSISLSMDEFTRAQYNAYSAIVRKSLPDQMRAWCKKQRAKIREWNVEDETPVGEKLVADTLCLDVYAAPKSAYGDRASSFSKTFLTLYDYSQQTALDIPRSCLCSEPALIYWFQAHMPHLALIWQEKRPGSFV